MSKILVITSAWLYWYCGLRFIEKQSVHFPILISHTMQYLIFMGFYLNKTMPNNRVIKRIIGTVNPVLFFYIFIVFLASMVLFTGKGLNLNYRELNIWQFCFTMTAINHYIIDSIAWRNLSFNSSLQKVFKRAVHSPT